MQIVFQETDSFIEEFGEIKEQEYYETLYMGDLIKSYVPHSFKMVFPS